MKRTLAGITKNVLVLGVVSFLTDVSSEMIYPILPVFVTAVLGAGQAFVGLIEGIAESTASLLKLASGIWSDRIRNRTRLVLAGYGLSACARPFMAAATSASAVLAVRVTDRIGKGIRTSPRDAMIADSVAPAVRGKAFGLHRSMDHAGAVVGPLVAAGLLLWGVKDLRTVFWLASLPGLVAVFLIVIGVRETPTRAFATPATSPGRFELPTGVLRRYLLVLFLFTLGNSSDVFLLLRARQLGVAVAALPLVWVALHVVKMGSTMPFGMLSDTRDRRRLIAGGWIVYAATYAGLAAASASWQAWALIGVYGIFYGMTEGVERALLADLSSPATRGAAYGWYHGLVGVGAFPASVIFGAIWQWCGSAAAFGFGAGLALIAAGLLLVMVNPRAIAG